MSRRPTPDSKGTASQRSALHDHPIFRGIDEAAIAQLFKYAKVLAFRRGAAIFSRGDSGDRLYAVRRGSVRISISSPDGRGATFNLIGSNDIFGEIALLDGQMRTANAIAHTDCELLAIERRDFLPFLERQPKLALNFIQLLCERLRRTSEQVEHIMLSDLSGRLAKTVLALSTKDGEQGNAIAVTQREISEMVGATRESVNKELRRWSRQHWITIAQGKITVLDPDALEGLAQSQSKAL
ncbi:MAG: Crp/Fnr family transcriptional regulator [Pseudomonadota bacterium]|jgi:CRP-like cAMP-binding protein